MKSYGIITYFVLAILAIKINAEKIWLPNVSGYSASDDNNGYAGMYNYPITGLTIDNKGYGYRVHILGGSWLSPVTGNSKSDANNGYAGTVKGDVIDAVAIDGGVSYAVHTVGGYWLPAVKGYDIKDSDQGFAGIYGKAIDAIMINGRVYSTSYNTSSPSPNPNPDPNPDPNPGSCNNMSLFKTSLTRSQFIKALKTYAASYSSLSLFANNAGTIYDISVNNGLNPELVVVRAMSEGFSPGDYTNNYWGLSCYNLSNSCASYSSFSEGVKAFIKNIKSNNYQTPLEMMKSYAFIGYHWYNPGSWSDGGCVYYPYIKQYMSAARSNQVNYACSYGRTCSGYEYNCLDTTPEDQNAYAAWTSQKMINDRNSVFNIKC